MPSSRNFKPMRVWLKTARIPMENGDLAGSQRGVLLQSHRHVCSRRLQDLSITSNATSGNFGCLALASLLRIANCGRRMSVIKEDRMRRTTWLLIGAVLIGIAIFLYIVFCPTECH